MKEEGSYRFVCEKDKKVRKLHLICCKSTLFKEIYDKSKRIVFTSGSLPSRFLFNYQTGLELEGNN